MKYIKGYDGLRAVSILLVLINHLGWHESIYEVPFYRDRVFPIIDGLAGVNVFFTLSGFLITLILLKEFDKSGRINFKNFFAKRFLRLFPPLLIFYTLILIVMHCGYVKIDHDAVIFSVVYLYNFVPILHYTGELGHTWSLAIEEQFYLTWPFALGPLLKRKLIVPILISLIGICAFVSFYMSNNYIPIELFGNEYSYFEKAKSTRWFIPAVAPILIGSLLAFVVNVTNKEMLFKIKDFLSSRKSVLFGLVLFASSLYMPLILKPMFYIVQSFGVALILSWIYYNQESNTTRFFNWEPLVFVGKISYGLYVYQGLFLRTGPGGEPWFQHYPTNLLLTIGLAILSYFTIEKWALNLKRRFI